MRLSTRKAHNVRDAGSIAANGYFVFGDGPVGGGEGLPPIDYSYDPGDSASGMGETVAPFPNGLGLLRLVCGGVEVDSIVWGTEDGLQVVSGRSTSFDGAVAPDAMLNDSADLLVLGRETYDDLNVGSPGVRNPSCGLLGCEEDGSMRDVVPPEEGDLVVTEVFADAVGADAGKEWVELYVAATEPLDLNGLVITNTNSTGRTYSGTVESLLCAQVQPGDFLVIAANADTGTNGNVEVDWVAAELELYGSESTIDVTRGPTLVDHAVLPAPEEGASQGLDPSALDASSNDTADAFCTSRTSNVFDGIGTPGLANDPCGATCLDGVAWRPQRVPAAGDLVLTELYPDPAGADNRREWIELYVAHGPVDLNGLRDRQHQDQHADQDHHRGGLRGRERGDLRGDRRAGSSHHRQRHGRRHLERVHPLRRRREREPGPRRRDPRLGELPEHPSWRELPAHRRHLGREPQRQPGQLVPGDRRPPAVCGYGVAAGSRRSVPLALTERLPPRARIFCITSSSLSCGVGSVCSRS